MAEPAPKKSESKSTGGYGKRPMWQWVVIYVVVAIVVYGLIYYVFMRDSGAGTSPY